LEYLIKTPPRKTLSHTRIEARSAEKPQRQTSLKLTYQSLVVEAAEEKEGKQDPLQHLMDKIPEKKTLVTVTQEIDGDSLTKNATGKLFGNNFLP